METSSNYDGAKLRFQRTSLCSRRGYSYLLAVVGAFWSACGQCDELSRASAFAKFLDTKLNTIKLDSAGIETIKDFAQTNSGSEAEYINTFKILTRLASAPSEVDTLKSEFVHPDLYNGVLSNLAYRLNEVSAINLTVTGERIVGLIKPAPEVTDCFLLHVKETNNQVDVCTGTLIAPNVILTAGHCVAHGRKITFVDNAQYPSRPGVTGVRRNVADVVPHPQYSEQRASVARNDLALVFLDRAVTNVAMAKIAPADALNTAGSVVVVGFGATDSTDAGIGRNKTTVGIVPPNDAKWPDYAAEWGCDPDLEFAAGQTVYGNDTCFGDSGGPAYVWINNQYYLAGSTSRSVLINGNPGTCGQGGIYERLDRYVQWIGQEIKNRGGAWNN